MTAHTERLVPYAEMREIVLSGDIFLWKPVSVMGRMICKGTSLGTGKSVRHSHASMVAFARNDRLYSLEMMQFVGGCHRLLSSEIAKYPGSGELWRAKCGFMYNRFRAADQMLWLMGQHYGWLDFFRIAIRMLCPHLIMPPAVDNDDPDDPRVCSSAVAWAIRTGGGVDVCPNISDDDTSPADIAQCGVFEYVCTPVL